MKTEFPQTVSYSRFVELTSRVCMPMTLFLKTCCMGECTGISFVDSTPINVLAETSSLKGQLLQGNQPWGGFMGLSYI